MRAGKAPYKRKRELDPTASDSNDEDYNEAEAVAPRKTTKPTPGRLKKTPKPSKPQYQRKKDFYSNDDDDEDDDDDDDISEISENEGQSEEDDAPLSVNKAGRPTRRAATKAHTYVESDPDDIKEEEEEIVHQQQKRGTRIIKLKLGGAGGGLVNPPTISPTELPPTPSIPRRTTRASSKEPTTGPRPSSSAGRSTRQGSVGASTRPTRSTRQTSIGPGKAVRQGSSEPTGPLGRRSSRLHPELESDDPLVKMTNSGNVEFIKPVGKQPSTVQEEDEESSGDHPYVPKAGDIAKQALDTSTEAVHGSRDTCDESGGGQDALGEADEGADAAIQPPELQIPAVDADHEDDEDDEELPTQRSRRKNPNPDKQPQTPPQRGSPRKGRAPSTVSPVKPRKSLSKSQRSQAADNLEPPRPSRRGGSRGGSQTRGSDDDDWKMDDEGTDSSDDMSGSEGSGGGKKKSFVVDDDEQNNSEPGRRSTRSKGSTGGGVSKRKRNPASEEDMDLQEEIANLQDSPGTRRSKRRAAAKEDLSLPRKPQLRERTGKVDYRIINPEFQQFGDDMLQTPILGPGGGFGGSKRPAASMPTLYGTSGPFGGWGAPTPIFGKTPFMGPTMDSDSSDDEDLGLKRRGAGTGATPSHHNNVGGTMPNLLPPTLMTNPALEVPTVAAPFGAGANQSRSGAGKSSADSDPLGVDQSVSFDSVGGHEEHIRQLREMVALPLMYPEIFQEFGISPPKGVLFHGPPGTGKTLMARALASSCSTQTGKKVTFYMRKGADCLSKWVGEAERQLRLLFEEAKNSQPSIIFFDEIDGLAPVRSAKQDQIHASIVSTLLALMDGMDGRGQVIVIGATNRPDSVDPALRRPGRFDREFYFPLPDVDARSKIIDIHTKNWTPPLSEDFKKELAAQTKGFGGADIRVWFMFIRSWMRVKRLILHFLPSRGCARRRP